MSNEQIADTIAAKVSAGVSAGAGLTMAAYGWLGEHLNTVAIVVGIFATIAPVIITYHFKRKRDKRDAFYRANEDRREQELHKAQLASLKQNSMYAHEYSEDS